MSWLITGITALPLFAAQDAAQTASEVSEEVADALQTVKRATFVALALWLVLLFVEASS